MKITKLESSQPSNLKKSLDFTQNKNFKFSNFFNQKKINSPSKIFKSKFFCKHQKKNSNLILKKFTKLSYKCDKNQPKLNKILLKKKKFVLSDFGLCEKISEKTNIKHSDGEFIPPELLSKAVHLVKVFVC